MKSKLLAFARKYDFPVHLTVLYRQHLIARMVRVVSTVLLKVKLRCVRCKYGRGLSVDGVPVIDVVRRGSVTLGDGCKINSRFRSNLVGKTSPTVLQCLGEGEIIIGDYSGMSFSILSSRARIEIGRHVNIGGNVRIFDHNYHSLNYLDRRDGKLDRQGCRSAPVKIGDDVFIGTNAIILKGVTVGDRVIIGAGSVVGSDVPADEIWAGNPAKFIKKLERIGA